jgi:hypothetical protein
VDESPALAGLTSASVQGRIAVGARAGARVWRLGDEPEAPWVLSAMPRHAHLAGFDLHANVAVPAADRAWLEQLCRDLLRPAVVQDRLRLLADGRVVLTLKSARTDGTRQLLFEPLTLLEKLAALIPRPRINLVLHHGVLTPPCGWRARVVACGGPLGVAHPCPGAPDASRSGPRQWPWAALMRRVFDVHVLACPRCGGRLRLIATVEDRAAIGAILAAASRDEAGRAPSAAAIAAVCVLACRGGPVPLNQILRSGRNSGDARVVRAVPGGGGWCRERALRLCGGAAGAENRRSVNQAFVPSTLHPMLSAAGFEVAPTPWQAVQRAAWMALWHGSPSAVRDH